VFDEYGLAALGNHRRDHLVHRVVHDVWRGWIVDIQIQLSPLIDARRLVVSLFDHEDLPTAEPGQMPHFGEGRCRSMQPYRRVEMLEHLAPAGGKALAGGRPDPSGPNRGRAGGDLAANRPREVVGDGN